ncbi:hypothetical protein HPP92_011833 [Vanilla planifolia]|uniref:Uncharacterized protein n=1 Tax=Vanilla planifolia TaxID=51239 RepID=A0A835R7Q2_VANPL|nr:hypothetical protein HPP92_011833 [Vanilla planifolia]
MAWPFSRIQNPTVQIALPRVPILSVEPPIGYFSPAAVSNSMGQDKQDLGPNIKRKNPMRVSSSDEGVLPGKTLKTERSTNAFTEIPRLSLIGRFVF